MNTLDDVFELLNSNQKLRDLDASIIASSLYDTLLSYSKQLTKIDAGETSYVCYEVGVNGKVTVWGSGTSKEDAISDSEFYIKDFNKYNKKEVVTKTAIATYYAKDILESHGGYDVGIVVTTDGIDKFLCYWFYDME